MLNSSEEPVHVRLRCTTGKQYHSTGAENIDVETEEQCEMQVNSDEATMLDSVFYTCDVDRKGFVKVSTIIDYLKNLTEDAESNEIKGFLDDLSLLLDPSGRDILIDARTYQDGVYRWVGDIKQKNISSSPIPQPSDQSQRNGMIYQGKGKSLQGPNEHALLTSKLSMESLEEMANWNSDMEESDIVEKITELQVLNRKLSEENASLQQQVETTEDNNNSLAQEVEKLRKKCTRYENLYDKAVLMERDYVELKTSVSDYENTKEQLTKKAGQLEKEVSVLQEALEECRQKVTEANMSETLWKEQNKMLQQELADQKSTCSKLEELLEVKTQLSNESSGRLEYMSAVISELTFANQMLKSDKNDLEAELMEVKQEFSRISINEDSRQPVLTSTPFHKTCPTLKDELKAETGMSPESVLAIKIGSREPSLEDEAFEKSSSSQNESGLSDETRSVSTTASMDKYSSVAQKIARKFKKRKEIALKQIEELAMLDASVEGKGRSEEITKELEDEMEFFSSKISSLALAKQVAERRAAKLFILYRRLKAENKCLKDSKGKILLQHFGTSLLTKDEMEKRNGLSFEHCHEHHLNIEKKFNEKNEERKGLDSVDRNCMPPSTFKRKNYIQPDLNEQVADLKFLVENLEGRQQDSDRRVFELEELLEAKSDLCIKQERKIHELEKMAVMQSPQNKEIMEILAMLPSLEGSSLKEPVTLYHIKERLADYIATVQAKIKRMGIRDSPDGGPVGCETETEVNQRRHRLAGKVTPEMLDYSLEGRRLIIEHMKSQGNQTESTSTVSSASQTDISFAEMDQIIISFNETHDLNHNFKVPSLIEPEFIVEEVKYEENENEMVSTESEDSQELCKGGEISSQDREAPLGEVEEDTVDNTTEVLQPNNPTLAVNGEEVRLSDVEESKQAQKMGSWSFDFNDKDTSCSEDELSMKMRLRKKRRSNESFEERQRAPSAVSGLSEQSSSSVSSRRERRIGISAEPVRLPTWSDLRELYKINQQLEMEDALQKEAQETQEVSADVHVKMSEDECTPNQDSVELTRQESTSSSSLNRLPNESSPRPELRKQRSVKFSLPEIEPVQPQMEVESLSRIGQELKSCMKDVKDSPSNDVPSAEETSRSPVEPSVGETQNCSSPSSFTYGGTSSQRSNSEGPPTFLTTFKSVTEVTDMERKFNNTVLNFRTDQYTLQKRLDNQERARDVAETGMEKELEKLTSAIKHLEKLSLTYELQEAIGSLHKNTDVLRRAGMKVSAQAEQHGCFQKEASMSPDIEIMISYAQHLRLKIESIHEEHESAKRRIRPATDPGSSVEVKPLPQVDRQQVEVVSPSKNEDTFRRAFSENPSQQDIPLRASGNSLYRLAKSLLNNQTLKEAAEGNIPPPATDETETPVIPRTANREKRSVTYASVDSIIPEEILEPQPVTSTSGKSWIRHICSAFLNFIIALALLTFILYIAVNYFEVDFDRIHRRFGEQVRIAASQYFYDPPEQSPL